MLSELSVAEADYQLRSFLLTPQRAPILLQMLVYVLAERSREVRQELKNIIVNRTVNLISSDLLTAECVPLCAELLPLVGTELGEVKERLDRCVSIADHNLK
jgi:hypothetical protein